MITRHLPDPLHVRETLCSAITTPEGVPQEHRLAEVGMEINCPQCRVITNMVRRCISPSRYVFVKTL